MKTIEITTSQKVTILYELATLWERMLAALIDIIIYLLAFGLVLYILVSLNTEFTDFFAMLMFIFAIGFVFMYELASETIGKGQSIGKKVMGIKTVKLNGDIPSLGEYAMRAVFRFLDVYLSLGSLGVFLIVSSNKSQRLGDVLAQTTVVRLGSQFKLQLSDINKINTMSNYEPKYTEVKHYTDDDMLLIKNALERYRKYPTQVNKDILNSLAKKIATDLDVPNQNLNTLSFLGTVINDYVVLTR